MAELERFIGGYVPPQTLETMKTHGALFMSQAPFAMYVVLARGSIDHIPAPVLVLLRFLGGFIALCVFHFFTSGRNMPLTYLSLHPKLRRDIAISGLVGAFGPITFVIGIKYTTAAVAAAIDASSPAVAIIIAMILRTDRLHWTHALCLLLSTIGNGLVLKVWEIVAGNQSKREADEHWREAFGAFMVLVSVAISVINFNIQRPIIRVIPAVDFVTYLLMIGLVIASCFAMTDPSGFKELLQPQAPIAWAVIIYAVCLQGWLHALFAAVAIRRSNPVMISMYTALVPGISSTLAYMWLGERLQGIQIIGVMFVVSSVLMSAWQFEVDREEEKPQDT